QELETRRTSIIGSLTERALLSDDLRQRLESAETLAILEDLYLPYRPKRRTRATMARARGLEPLAERLRAQDPGLDPWAAAGPFVDPEKGVETAEVALAGARDILAEMISEDANTRQALRQLFEAEGRISSTVVRGKEEEGQKFRDWFDWSEPVTRAAGHRVLAMLRGESEGILRLKIRPADDKALLLLDQRWVKGRSPAAAQMRLAVEDGYDRLLAPSLENEIRQLNRERCEREAIQVFARNVRELLMAPALGQKAVLAVDPGLRTGCKTVCLDPQGKLLYQTVLYFTGSERHLQDSMKTAASLVDTYHLDVIALGNGTGSREAEAILRRLPFSRPIPIVVVNESGASVYSASEAAREEFPDQDVTVRGAVSIGRRLQDPLAELVKIDPKAIGVGQYQHDVDQNALKRELDDVVRSCVNAVGVEVNTASKRLLTYVSGLGPTLAANIVAWREANGPFQSRKDLQRVPRLGPKAFEQAAGFLRVRQSDHPLDASAVHPERYTLVERMARDAGSTVYELVQNESRRRQIELSRYVDAEVGLPTLNDILQELARPGRDPRAEFELFAFDDAVHEIEDLTPGMKLPGIVTNVTRFGAFVDVGVHQDGLVHISELADRFVRDPAEVVKVGQRVMVMVLEVDRNRRRIALSLKTGSGASRCSVP
ncbi:MAG TPA: Tex family protein, partial [Candidatus Ozemobacteraceae bacterium]|nr:Tex family protein [Candidatus Ozemobacteraceae bacterium]